MKVTTSVRINRIQQGRIWSSIFREEPKFNTGGGSRNFLSEGSKYKVFGDYEAVNLGTSLKGRTQFYEMIGNRRQTIWKGRWGINIFYVLTTLRIETSGKYGIPKIWNS